MNNISLPCKLGNHTKSLPVSRGQSFERHSKCKTKLKSLIFLWWVQARYQQTLDFIIIPHDKAVPMNHMQTKSPVTILIIPLDDSFSSPIWHFFGKQQKEEKRREEQGLIFRGIENRKTSPFFAVLLLSIPIISQY